MVPRERNGSQAASGDGRPKISITAVIREHPDVFVTTSYDGEKFKELDTEKHWASLFAKALAELPVITVVIDTQHNADATLSTVWKLQQEIAGHSDIRTVMRILVLTCGGSPAAALPNLSAKWGGEYEEINPDSNRRGLASRSTVKSSRGRLRVGRGSVSADLANRVRMDVQSLFRARYARKKLAEKKLAEGY